MLMDYNIDSLADFTIEGDEPNEVMKKGLYKPRCICCTTEWDT